MHSILPGNGCTASKTKGCRAVDMAHAGKLLASARVHLCGSLMEGVEAKAGAGDVDRAEAVMQLDQICLLEDLATCQCNKAALAQLLPCRLVPC